MSEQETHLELLLSVEIANQCSDANTSSLSSQDTNHESCPTILSIIQAFKNISCRNTQNGVVGVLVHPLSSIRCHSTGSACILDDMGSLIM